jgi:hypothetical protein
LSVRRKFVDFACFHCVFFFDQVAGQKLTAFAVLFENDKKKHSVSLTVSVAGSSSSKVYRAEVDLAQSRQGQVWSFVLFSFCFLSSNKKILDCSSIGCEGFGV